ncbi:MAG: hypothetical protein RBR53_08565 [Desulforegulaceae bacterium]|nr:hypothetical protein [Desulforegulaceae bacterium]
MKSKLHTSAALVMKKTAIVKKSMKKIKTLFLFILVLCFASCSGSEKREDPFELQILGNWNCNYRRSFIIMSLKANGNWESQVRQHGHFSEVVQKKGSQKGKWKLSDKNKYFEIIVESGDEIETGWKPGNSYEYLITLVSDEKFILTKEDSGAEMEWIKPRPKKSGSAGVDSDLIYEQEVEMEPLIINLKKRTPYSKERFICVSLSFIKNLNTPVKTNEPAPVFPLHPSFREELLFYFSSLEYNEINKFTKVREHLKKIEKIAKPYFKGELKEIKLNNIIVAGTRGSLEEFLIQYPQQMARFGMVPPQTSN